MSYANAVEALSKAGSHKPSKNRKTQRHIRNDSLQPVQTAAVEPVVDPPDVEHLRKARTEFFTKSPTMRIRDSSREMTDIVNSQSQQVGSRGTSRRSSTRTEHESLRRQHGRHRHRRKVDDEEEDRNIIYDYKQPGDGRRSQVNGRSQDRLSTAAASAIHRGRSTRSTHQRPDAAGLLRRHTTSLVDVVSRPLKDIAKGGRESGRSYERSGKRPTTRKRYSERGTHRTEQPHVTRYVDIYHKRRKVLTISGARRCTKDPPRCLALRFKEATQRCGRRKGPFPSHRWRYLRFTTKPRICLQVSETTREARI